MNTPDITPEQQREIERLVAGREPHWIDGLTFDGIYYRFNGEMDADTFTRACLDLDRNKGPALLFDLYHAGALDIGECPSVVADVWSMAEFPESRFDLPTTWVDLFEYAGYTHDRQPAPRPSAPITIYRGCHPERRFGMSWTADLDQARWFANRDLEKGTGQVYVFDAPPKSMLAFIHESHRREAEYVIDPYYLSDDVVKLLE